MGIEERSGDGTVGKALEVLDAVAAFGRPVRYGELLERLPFPKATLYRLVQTLASQRMLAYDPERGTYAPGLRLVRMAHAAWSVSSLAPIARPHLDALAAHVGETIHLAQLDGGHVLYVDKRRAARAPAMYAEAGKIGPAYCTGVGKAMLAFLPEAALEAALAQQSWHRFTPATITDPEAMRAELEEVRAKGRAFDREEHEPGIRCVAVPILSEGGRVLGALSVTVTGPGPARGGGDVDLLTHLPHLRRAAKGIAGALRDWRFPDHAGER